MVECIDTNRDRLGLVLFHALWGKSLAESTSHLRCPTSSPKLRIPWSRRHFRNALVLRSAEDLFYPDEESQGNLPLCKYRSAEPVDQEWTRSR